MSTSKEIPIGEDTGLPLYRPVPPEGQEAPELVPDWAGEFRTFQDWVNRAQRALAGPSHRPSICVDAKGRRCSRGKDMMLARDEDAFPVRYFWECKPAAPRLSLPVEALPTDWRRDIEMLKPELPEHLRATPNGNHYRDGYKDALFDVRAILKLAGERG